LIARKIYAAEQRDRIQKYYEFKPEEIETIDKPKQKKRKRPLPNQQIFVRLQAQLAP